MQGCTEHGETSSLRGTDGLLCSASFAQLTTGAQGGVSLRSSAGELQVCCCAKAFRSQREGGGAQLTDVHLLWPGREITQSAFRCRSAGALIEGGRLLGGESKSAGNVHMQGAKCRWTSQLRSQERRAEGRRGKCRGASE